MTGAPASLTGGIDLMKELDDLQIKKEIDDIAKKIDAIVQNIEHLDPNRQEPDDKSE
jgi:hypothetical protein